MKDFLSVQKVAELLGMDEGSIYGWINKSMDHPFHLPAFRFGAPIVLSDPI